MSDIMLACDRNGIIQDANRSLRPSADAAPTPARHQPVRVFVDPLAAGGGAPPPVRPGAQEVTDCELLRARDGDCGAGVAEPHAALQRRRQVASAQETGARWASCAALTQALYEAHEDLSAPRATAARREDGLASAALRRRRGARAQQPDQLLCRQLHALQHASRPAGSPGDHPRALAPARLEAARRLAHRPHPRRPSSRLSCEGTIEGAERTRAIVDGLKRFRDWTATSGEDSTWWRSSAPVRWVRTQAARTTPARAEPLPPPRDQPCGSPGCTPAGRDQPDRSERERKATTAGDGPPSCASPRRSTWRTCGCASTTMAWASLWRSPAHLRPLHHHQPVGEAAITAGCRSATDRRTLRRHAHPENRPEAAARLVLTAAGGGGVRREARRRREA